MFRFSKAVLLCAVIITVTAVCQGAPIIADHNSASAFFGIPQTAIEQAKSTLHIAYGHTSHGSQLITGMDGLVSFMNGLGYPNNLYAWGYGGDPAALDLHDYAMGGDVGYYPDWVDNTVSYLGPPDSNTGRGTTHPETNVIIWSWCGQAASQTEQSMIDVYLAPMTQLELDYPGVKFVYMTGHLDGSGQTGNLNLRNNQIRNYCIANGKILYDFADIESYDPDGLVNYMVLIADDNCAYDSDNNGSRESNWAINWQGSHTINVAWYDCSPAHTQALNGNRKAYAAWWLWARLAGWGECIEAPSALTAVADSNASEIELNWTDNSAEPNNEDSFIIQRSVNGGAWDNDYASAGADVTTYMDVNLTPGSYSYRVIAHLNTPCDSSPSNTAAAFISTDVPAAPSNLNSAVSGLDVTLTWNDNSDNEEHFVIERAADAGRWYVRDGSVAPDTEIYYDRALLPGHTYTYRIKARNGLGESGYSNEDSSEVVAQGSTEITLKQDVNSYTGCRDAYLNSANPTYNYGNTPYTYVQNNPKWNFVIGFDLPAEVIGKQISSATLILYCWTVSNWTSGQYLQLYRVTEQWQEGTADGSFQAGSVSWNIRTGTTAWTTPGGTYAPALLASSLIPNNSYYPQFDITALAQEWADGMTPNYGVILVNNTPVITGIKASEYSEYGRPRLVINYTDKATGCPNLYGEAVVDFRDFSVLAEEWLSGWANQFADLDGDNTVDVNDLTVFTEYWLQECD
jgi:hypothetical protein